MNLDHLVELAKRADEWPRRNDMGDFRTAIQPSVVLRLLEVVRCAKAVRARQDALEPAGFNAASDGNSPQAVQAWLAYTAAENDLTDALLALSSTDESERGDGP